MKSGLARHAANNPSAKPVRVIRLRYSAGMIWSVSTLLRRSGTARPVTTLKGCIGAPLVEVGRRAETAGDGRRRCNRRRNEMGAAAGALPAFEVAVGRRRAA